MAEDHACRPGERTGRRALPRNRSIHLRKPRLSQTKDRESKVHFFKYHMMFNLLVNVTLEEEILNGNIGIFDNFTPH